MSRIILLIFLCFFMHSTLFSQELDTLKFCKKAKHTPHAYSQTPEILAHYLTADYTDAGSKVLAISSWIATNIRYNYKAFVKRKITGWDSKMVLKKRKALCGEYAQLFYDMCQSVGVRAETINGYTRDFDLFPDDKLYRDEHAWSAVKIEGKWHLLDITWASGYIKPRSQWGARLGWRLMRIPYHQKFKYVHQLNPKWISVHPEKMIETHIPLLDDFQFLRKTMPIDSFIQGKKAISFFQENFPNNAAQPSYLNQYTSLDELSKKLSEAERGHHSNPANHRIKAINYNQAVEIRTWQLAQRQEKGLELRPSELEQVRRWKWTADSCFAQSIKDNQTEFRTKEARSLAWYKLLEKQNRILIDSLRIRSRTNIQQINLIKRIRAQREAQLRLATDGIHHWSKYEMRRLRRPQRANPKTQDKRFLELSKAADLGEEAQALTPLKDSLLAHPDSEKRLQALQNEEKVKLLFEQNLSYMKWHLTERRKGFGLIYRDESSLYKPWLHSKFQQADSLNRHITSPYLQQMYDNPKAAYKLMASYKRLQDKRIRHVMRAKRLSMEDLGEDALYEQIRLEYDENFKQYLDQISNYYASQRAIRKNLITSRHTLKKISQRLYQDIHLEKLRHRTYRRHRLLIQQAEDRRIRYYFP